MNDPLVIPVSPQPIKTPEEIAAVAAAAAAEAARQLKAQQEAKRREAEAQRLRNLAEKRAEALLLSLLNRNQRLEYKLQRQITIWKGDKKWVLAKERSYNVLEYDEQGKLIAKHCVQTVGTPMADQLAAQYLYMHTDPDLLIRTANHQQVH
jgi:undecaprenyl pyrophosphate synthase